MGERDNKDNQARVELNEYLNQYMEDRTGRDAHEFVARNAPHGDEVKANETFELTIEMTYAECYIITKLIDISVMEYSNIEEIPKTVVMRDFLRKYLDGVEEEWQEVRRWDGVGSDMEDFFEGGSR